MQCRMRLVRVCRFDGGDRQTGVPRAATWRIHVRRTRSRFVHVLETVQHRGRRRGESRESGAQGHRVTGDNAA